MKSTNILMTFMGVVIIGGGLYFASQRAVDNATDKYVVPAPPVPAGDVSNPVNPPADGQGVAQPAPAPEPVSPITQVPPEEPPVDGLPYCNNPDEGYHLSLATKYLNDEYVIDEESEEMTGACNNGNMASTKFDVYDMYENNIGFITVDGDSEEVYFTFYKDTNSGLTITSPEYGERIILPITIEGTVDATKWGALEGEAGNVKVFGYHNGEEKALSTTILTLEDFDYEETEFTFSIVVGDRQWMSELEKESGYLLFTEAGAKDDEVLDTVVLPIQFDLYQ